MQTLIFHMHGLGDMVMFAPTFNQLPNKKKTVDIVVFENNTIEPIKASKKINRIYYCNSSYLILVFNLLKIFLNKYELLIFSNNSSPIKSLIVSFLLKANKKVLLSEGKIFFKPQNIKIIKVNRNLHKIYRNLLLINLKKNNKIDTSLYFEKVKLPPKLIKSKINVGIHPGSNLKNGDKRWDLEKYKIIIDYLIKKKCNVFIFVGKYENEILNKLKFKSKNLKIIVNKDLKYVAELIKNLDLLLSNETGLAHLSSFLGIQTVVIINDLYNFSRRKISIPIKNTFFQKKTANFSDVTNIKNYLKKHLKF